MADRDLVLFSNIGLGDPDTGGQTSTVGEPSMGNNGAHMFVTGNWYAAKSTDGGASWDQVDPFTQLPPADGGFCCDQTVIYDPSRDAMFWLLQYITAANTNTLRVAVKPGATFDNNLWHWYDFQPDTVNAAWSGEWFDYNHAALSNNFLYVATNVFRVSNDTWTRSVVIRLPLDELVDGSGFNYRYFQSTDNFSLRCTQGARDTMHFGSHNTNSQIRVFSWPESSDTTTHVDVDVTAWSAGNYSAPGPDGNNWLARCDPRITGGWVANGEMGFLWTANGFGGRPMPHVRAVRLNESSRALIDEPDIWHTDFAYAYPDVSPNDRGHLGISLFMGGGADHPTHVVGVRDDYLNSWDLQVTQAGTDGPGGETWGDYVACRRHSPDGLTWTATGYTLQGGTARGNIEPRVVHFGRERDRGAVDRWDGA